MTQETSGEASTGGLEVIESEQFAPSFAVSPTDEGATRRRCMTLLTEHEDEHAPSTRLSDAQLLHVQNTEGTSFWRSPRPSLHQMSGQPFLCPLLRA